MSLGDTSSAKMRLAQEHLTSGKPTPIASATFANWYNLPITGESLAESLTSAQSGAMRDDRQMSGTRLVRGENAGDLNLEAAMQDYFDLLLEGALQVSTPFGRLPLTQPANGAGSNSTEATTYADATYPYIAGDIETLANGKTQIQYAIEKKLTGGDGTDYFDMFRGCQVNTLTFDFQSNSLATFTAGIRGLNVDQYETTPKAGTEVDYDLDDMFDTAANAEFDFYDKDDNVLEVTAQNLTLAIDNQMRGQQAVGHFGDAGVASGRIKVTLSGSFYFYDKELTKKFKANEGIKVFITLTNSAGFKYRFRMYNVKVTSDNLNAGGADQDLMQNLELQAFPDTTYVKTIIVDRMIPELP